MISMVRLWSAIMAVLAVLAMAPAASAQGNRIALVITNQNYTQPGARLTNTHHDGDLVKGALEAVGFAVTVVRDARSEGELTAAIAAHVARLSGAGPEAVGFFYYSGHGAADRPNGENYLIPTQAPLTHVNQLPLLAVKLEKITEALARAGRMSFLVFDACRNVPLERDDKSLTFKGFAPVREQGGLLVAFATEPGNVAVDQSLYAKVLAEEIVRPGIEASQAFRAVTRRVRQETGSRQSPEYLDKRLHDFQFAAAVAPPPVAPATPAGGAAEVVRVCREVEGLTSLSTLGVLERQHRGTPAADCISARIGELKAAQAAVSDAERQRVALLTKQDDDRKRSEAEAAARAADERRKAAEEAALRDPAAGVTPGSGQSFKDRLADGSDCPDCPEMVVVPAGSFMMGSPNSEQGRSSDEGPLRRVTIAKPFAVGKFEVTFAEWDACVSEGGCKHKPETSWGRGRQPVMRVSWDDIAKEYLPWLSKKTGKTYRLLTEAEWEYAARAGTTTPFSFGQTISIAEANYNGNYTYGSGRKGVYREKTIEVGSLNKPNAWGLHDMHGNVWEWVQDCYANTYNGAPTDGRAANDSAGCSRVLRGGSWGYDPLLLRSANRSGNRPVNRNSGIGFRLARTLNP
ncbi:MAG: SUMF1/EgtB/PvdO family nonheme iron enzyme [Hyphomicrobiales bacterium]|nr:SUMF1/EgtB/PvdO family nonheme iron enzyme [Hyphomicrobiales bacterium]